MCLFGGKHKAMPKHRWDTLNKYGMKPKAVRRYVALRANIDRRRRRITALSGVLGGLEDAAPGNVNVDDIAFVAGMIQMDAYDTLECLNDFAASEDVDADPTSQ